ncbi:LPS assembly lipoprotein LptE [Pseudoalteromonas sp. CnMc7-15]|uniref:LPS-assembly lipoprotein LptE n=1 Tax=unclassified Pseudoalteromonas TaxID=194690 RepID=UPI001EF61EE4|nr:MULTISPECIES: LPS assembly lipoprotein LptE [unclassified Pseudoalteromonas]MCG7567540.1 LPS assembly lipoprotein LptE [Pseudoalteromonas sp. CnMc7-15]MCG7571084.1 LPS assembly lipoprotein LptE [Pseudoalteromonas sp. CNC9-20]
MFAASALRHSLVISCLVLLLGSCGFHLKKASDLPQDLMTLEVNASDPNSALYEQLLSELARSNVQVNKGLRANSPMLRLTSDRLDRRTLSLFKNGQVAEYELIYSVSYTLKRAGEDPIEQYFELYRNYQDDPDNALAKANEMTILLEELRKQASRRIVRELAQL